MLTRCVNVCLLLTSAELLDGEKPSTGALPGRQGLLSWRGSSKSRKKVISLHFTTAIKKNRPNRISCHVMWTGILKFASFSSKQECSSCPLVVPVAGAAPTLVQAPEALCRSHLSRSGLLLLQHFTGTQWQSLQPPIAFWKKNEEQTGSIHSERPIYIESNIKLQMEK